MKKIFFAIFSICFISINAIANQETQEEFEKRVEEARAELEKEFLTEENLNNSKQISKNVDFITSNYNEKEKRELILNMEKLERRSKKRLKEEYVPYDRRIDVGNEDSVKRYFRKRSSAVFE